MIFIFSYELIAILFWFFAESFVECVVFDGRELRKKHALAARLACCKVVFSSSYDEEDYSKDVLKLQGSVLTNKYAEGYSHKDIMVDVYILMK